MSRCDLWPKIKAYYHLIFWYVFFSAQAHTHTHTALKPVSHTPSLDSRLYFLMMRRNPTQGYPTHLKVGSSCCQHSSKSSIHSINAGDQGYVRCWVWLLDAEGGGVGGSTAEQAALLWNRQPIQRRPADENPIKAVSVLCKAGLGWVVIQPEFLLATVQHIFHPTQSS